MSLASRIQLDEICDRCGEPTTWNVVIDTHATKGDRVLCLPCADATGFDWR